jgi:hypothetical protein
MENDDLIRDDFLRRFIRETPLESPSGDFVSNVMESVGRLPVAVKEKRSLVAFLKAAWPYAASLAVVLFILFTSDIPYSEYLPGKEYFTRQFIPFFTRISEWFTVSFSFIRSGSLLIIVVVSAGILFALDWILTRRRHSKFTFSL